MDALVTNVPPIVVPPIVVPPTALIEVLDTHGRIHSRHRLNSVGSTCMIGRSVACDIVLDDPYAAPEHTTLTLLEDGRIAIADLGSRNGTRVDGQRIETGAPATITDGELIIGRTRVRIRTTLTALTPERLFRRDLLQRKSSLLAVVGLVLCVGYVGFNRWIAFPDPLAPRILTAVMATVGALSLWSGLWGVITRVGHGVWTLRMHFAIAANAVGLCAWSDWLFDVAIFSSGWNWLAVVNAFLIGSAILVSLYLHLRKATHFTIRTAAIIAAALPLILGGAAVWISQQNNVGDINRVSYGPNVYAPQLRWVTSTDLNDYLTEVDSLKREANRKRRLSLAERPLAESE
jgi:hypothetical protein